MNIKYFERLTLKEKIRYIERNIENKTQDKKIFALLSGGKDSTLSFILAKNAGLNIEKIVNFTHRWTWSHYKPILKKISKKHNTKLEFINFTPSILNKSPNGLIGYKGIPCKFCKKAIFSQIYAKAIDENVQVILSGYNRMDDISRIVESRLDERILDHDNMEFNQISKYEHQKEVFELRPVIRLTDDEVIECLKYFGIKIERSHEANPQFSYWREGCPMQYIDRDVPITEELLDLSTKLNHILSPYAKNRNIRASIFVPSMKILTIPEGYEEECRTYLENRI